MEINHKTGTVYDAVAYTINYFNMSEVYAQHKPLAKNEDDIFANYYEFRKKFAVTPPDDMYLFFFFDGTTPALIADYLQKNFTDFNCNAQSVFELLKDRDRFKKFTYSYLLKPSEKELEDVIKGDVENTLKAVALLSAKHVSYPMLVYKLFCKFDELVDSLISYLKVIIHKVNIYHMNKGREAFQTAVNDFLNSGRVNDKSLFFDENFDEKFGEKQNFAVSFFRSFVIHAPPNMNNEATLIIGDKCSGLLA